MEGSDALVAFSFTERMRHEVMPGPDPSTAPGFEDAEELAAIDVREG
ncbi:MAG TPA: hypothetical protein VF148_08040 [Acidimicrobiia bacterium]